MLLSTVERATAETPRIPIDPLVDFMTLFNEELKYVCAWGRWRIGPALNEPLACSERRRPAVRPRLLAVAGSRHRGRARLRLVGGTAIASAARVEVRP
jgi:hypothetical protein